MILGVLIARLTFTVLVCYTNEHHSLSNNSLATIFALGVSYDHLCNQR